MAARVLLAVTLQQLGRTDEAKGACDEALELSHRTTHTNSRCYVLHFASMYAQLAGDRELTWSLSEEALRIADDQGLSLWKGWCRIMRGWACLWAMRRSRHRRGRNESGHRHRPRPWP